MRSDGRPAVSERIVSLAGKYSLRVMETIVKTDERISVDIVAVDLVVYCIECEMISSISILSLVVDGRAYYFYAACAEVSLEVGAVVLRVPKAPFCKGEEGESLFSVALVSKNYLLYFARVILRYKESSFGFQTVFLTCDDGIAHTMAALIEVKLCLYR